MRGWVEAFRGSAQERPRLVRLFLGYSGWGPGQLEFEIAKGGWLSAEAAPETIFDVPAEEMWDHVVRGMGIAPSSLVATAGVH